MTHQGWGYATAVPPGSPFHSSVLERTYSNSEPNSFFSYWSPPDRRQTGSPIGINGLSPHEDDIWRNKQPVTYSPIGVEPISPKIAPTPATPPTHIHDLFNNSSEFLKHLSLSPSISSTDGYSDDEDLDSFQLPPSAFISEHEEFLISMGGMDDILEQDRKSLPSYSKVAARIPPTQSTIIIDSHPRETAFLSHSHGQMDVSNPIVSPNRIKSPLVNFPSTPVTVPPVSPQTQPSVVPPDSPTQYGEHPYGEHPSRTLFVRNINSNVEDDELRSWFEAYGPIRSMYTQCKHRGFVMISYFDIRHAKGAMRNLQGKQLRRRKLDIHYSIPKDNPSEKDQNQGTLVVFNLDPSITSEELRSIFGAYGEIKEIRETPNKKHHKFIEFYDVREAEYAMKQLNKTEIKSKKIKIEPSRPGGRKSNSSSPTSPRSRDENSLSYPDNSPVDSYLSKSAPSQPSDFGGVIKSPNRAAQPRPSPRLKGMIPDSPTHPSPEDPFRSPNHRVPVSPRSDDESAFKIRLDLLASPPQGSLSAKFREDDRNQFVLNIENVRNGVERRTTLMIKNIPNKYTQKMLLCTVDEAHKGLYDFFYLPIDFKNKCNVGYAFINFIDPLSIVSFYEKLHNSKWEKFNSEKVCEIAFARIQGKDALISHFQNSSLMSEDKKCRPIIFHSGGPNMGQQAPFPIGPNVRIRDKHPLSPRRKEEYRTASKNSQKSGRVPRSRSYSSKV